MTTKRKDNKDNRSGAYSKRRALTWFSSMQIHLNRSNNICCSQILSIYCLIARKHLSEERFVLHSIARWWQIYLEHIAIYRRIWREFRNDWNQMRCFVCHPIGKMVDERQQSRKLTIISNKHLRTNTGVNQGELIHDQITLDIDGLNLVPFINGFLTIISETADQESTALSIQWQIS